MLASMSQAWAHPAPANTQRPGISVSRCPSPSRNFTVAPLSWKVNSAWGRPSPFASRLSARSIPPELTANPSAGLELGMTASGQVRRLPPSP